jgi:zinc transport system substrate-binding protein
MRKDFFLLFIFSIVYSVVSYPRTEANHQFTIVATTSLIGSIVQEVGGDKVELVTIVPSGMCPGHFDIKPGDVKALEDAQVILEHGFEGESFIEKMLPPVNNEDSLRVTLNVKGNWMVPEVYILAIDKIVEVLCRVKPEYADFFKSKASSYKEELLGVSSRIRHELTPLRVGEIKVVCSKMQTEFLAWLGFDIVATYDRPEDFTPGELEDIIRKAREANIKLVVDNLQSGAKAGVPIANELRCPRVVLTNFPKDFEGKLSYIESLKENVSKVLGAIRE